MEFRGVRTSDAEGVEQVLAGQLYHVGLRLPWALLKVRGWQHLGADAAAPHRHRNALAGTHGRSLQEHSILAKGPQIHEPIKGPALDRVFGVCGEKPEG